MVFHHVPQAKSHGFRTVSGQQIPLLSLKLGPIPMMRSLDLGQMEFFTLTVWWNFAPDESEIRRLDLHSRLGGKVHLPALSDITLPWLCRWRRKELLHRRHSSPSILRDTRSEKSLHDEISYLCPKIKSFYDWHNHGDRNESHRWIIFYWCQ